MAIKTALLCRLKPWDNDQRRVFVNRAINKERRKLLGYIRTSQEGLRSIELVMSAYIFIVTVALLDARDAINIRKLSA